MLKPFIIIIALLLSGLAAGIYFYEWAGGIPAYKNISAGTLTEYHQVLDGYMSKRMPALFLSGQISLLLWLIIERKDYVKLSFILLIIGFFLTIIETVITFQLVKPINAIIES